MACPILPGTSDYASVYSLYESFNPHLLETIWCEPYNDRTNWKNFFQLMPESEARRKLKRVMSDKSAWAEYALGLAETHATIVEELGFKGESIFLLYESNLSPRQIERAKNIPGVLFQSNPTLNADYLPLFEKDFGSEK